DPAADIAVTPTGAADTGAVTCGIGAEETGIAADVAGLPSPPGRTCVAGGVDTGCAAGAVDAGHSDSGVDCDAATGGADTGWGVGAVDTGGVADAGAVGTGWVAEADAVVVPSCTVVGTTPDDGRPTAVAGPFDTEGTPTLASPA